MTEGNWSAAVLLPLMDTEMPSESSKRMKSHSCEMVGNYVALVPAKDSWALTKNSQNETRRE
jgi:hypothetical protein